MTNDSDSKNGGRDDGGDEPRVTHSTARDQARELRKRMTPAERSFWERVRAKRFLGVKWRRQHPMSPFVLDFYCHAWRLVVELDGLAHVDRQHADSSRDDALQSLGLRVERISNEAWFRDPEGCSLDSPRAISHQFHRDPSVERGLALRTTLSVRATRATRP
jgi:very-short-patch-repair endonuclease